MLGFKEVLFAGLKQNIGHYVRNCLTCEANRASYRKQVGSLRPWPIRVGPWECVSMDLITSLPESRGSDAIFVVVDRFCKLAKMEPSKGMAAAFDKVVLHFHCLVPAPWVAEDQSDWSVYLGLAVGS
jgi:hypothetical protein